MKVDKFWTRVIRGASDECWPWTGALVRGGYGQARFGGRHMGAHRLAFLLATGHLDESLDVLHSCDNPPCCNPAHLRQGTDSDNTADKIARNRIPVGSKQANSKLTEADVAAILAVPCEPHTVLAERFGVRFQTIQALRAGRTWRHVPGQRVAPKKVAPILPRVCLCGCGESFKPPYSAQRYLNRDHWRSSDTNREIRSRTIRDARARLRPWRLEART